MDPKGSVVVITGATSGLGQHAAADFAKRGARVILVGRDEARAKETASRITAAGGQADAALGDVSTREGVKAVAKQILAKTSKIDVLLNCAGGTFKSVEKTQEGVERTFALNVLSAYLLERELHPALAAGHGRVVNVATGFLDRYPIEVDELLAPKKYSAFSQYGKVKNALVMMTAEQATRFQKDGITAVSVHPGIIMGTRFGGGQPKVAQLIGGPIMRAIGLGATIEQAGERFRIACFDSVPNGGYLVKGKPAPLPKPAQDATTRAKVMALLDKLATA